MNLQMERLQSRIQDAIRKIVSDPAVRGTLTLASCTCLGSGLIIAVAPVITHLFTPEMFGMVAVYTAIVSIGAPVACLRYDLAILLPENDEDAADVLKLSLVVLMPLCGLLALCTWLWSNKIAGWLHAEALGPFLWLAPVGIFGAGAYQSLSSWALRKQEYGTLARTRLTQNGGMAITQIGLGALLSGNPIALLLGDLVSRFGGVAILTRHVWQCLREKKLSSGRILANAKRYVKFPLLSTPASLLTAIELQIPIVLLSHYFGASVVGWYALTSRVLRAPTTLIGQAAAQVLLANAARASRDSDRLQRLTERSTIVLMAVGLPLFALVIQEGPELFSRLFGANWERAGLYARILAPPLFISFVANPLSNLLNVREWQGTTLLYSALECATAVICLMIGVAQHSDLIALAALGVGSCLLSLATVNRFFKAGFTDAGRIGKQAAPLLLPLLLCFLLAGWRFGGGSISALLLRMAVFSSVYFLSIWKLRRFASVRA